MSPARRATPGHAASRGWRSRGRASAAGALAGQVARALPWVPLVAGCCVGIGITADIARLSGPVQQPADLLTAVRAAFVPALAGLAFLLHDPYRQLAGALPTPAWLTSALRVAMALPVLGLTCLLQLHLGALALSAVESGNGPHPPVLPATALGAEFAACCAVALAAGAVVSRSRWHDLGGAVALPCALVVLAALAAGPLHLLPTVFVGMTSAQRHEWLRAWLLWALLGIAAVALACWSSRDPWHLTWPHRTRIPDRPDLGTELVV